MVKDPERFLVVGWWCAGLGDQCLFQPNHTQSCTRKTWHKGTCVPLGQRKATLHAKEKRPQINESRWALGGHTGVHSSHVRCYQREGNRTGRQGGTVKSHIEPVWFQVTRQVCWELQPGNGTAASGFHVMWLTCLFGKPKTEARNAA